MPAIKNNQNKPRVVKAAKTPKLPLTATEKADLIKAALRKIRNQLENIQNGGAYYPHCWAELPKVSTDAFDALLHLGLVHEDEEDPDNFHIVNEVYDALEHHGLRYIKNHLPELLEKHNSFQGFGI
jgi:hypothetical protein